MHDIEHLKPSGKPKFIDRGIKKAGEMLVDWNGEKVSGIGLIGMPLSKTSISHSGASAAPEVIRKMLNSFTTYSIEKDIDLQTSVITDLGDIMPHVTDLKETQSRFEHALEGVLKHNPGMIPIILGGDHSISASSIAAFSNIYGSVGIIQFDAHHDLRNLEDGGPSNGTPFRNLIERNKIKGEHLIQIGLRDFSNGKTYSDYAKEKGVTVYPMSEVNSRGIIPILEESIQQLKSSVSAVYVSVDMDVLDQAFAPGCPAIGPGGMHSEELIRGIQFLSTLPIVKGMDLVEIDPAIDFRDMTSRLAAYLILQFLLFQTSK
ncbi:formimidoylglutamase [Fictibacillus sp. WQ 8-8]|uniref:formimidoylglutamase n=1 Tax=unclassified Fictibacillus TaxID=2644029 RepID=UPI00210B0B87|nr:MULTISPECIES: formimidoylglutamase [unclassified Fictibacillus]MCQ6266948.1 formimidoylglutamase [Fictibacillus sp. WQ 8-8]MED2973981.1 formimidoylglutamase [Fictibacillus sp. B-59209]